MKFTLLLLPLLCAALPSFSQQYRTLPDFGKVDISELKLNECSFDKNAPAMFFFREGKSLSKIQGTALGSSVFDQMEIRVRLKIFNKSGFDAANIKIRYPISDQIAIKKLSAQTYNLDPSGQIIVTKLEKSNVYDKKINKRWAEKSFAMPDVKEGSVIEYQYTIDGYYSDVWYFQQSMPVVFSRIVMNLPVELITTPVPSVSMPMQKGNSLEDNNTVSWYEMENIPGLRDEPYMSAEKDYLQRIEIYPIAIDIRGIPRINLREEWPKLIKDLLSDPDFGEQLKKDIPRTADLDEMLKPITDPYQKMVAIHRYVRKNMQWNNFDNIWALNGVKSAWKDKKGTSGEINLILVNLLKDAGLKAHAILVSTMDNGTVNASVPELSQFNKVMAYVEIGDKFYVLDAIEKYTPSYLIPEEVMASEGLLISNPESNEWGWKTLWDGEHKYSKDIQLSANIDEKGMMKGTANIKSSDYARVSLMPLVKQGGNKEKEKLTTISEVVIDSLADDNVEDDAKPIVQNVSFSAPTTVTGDYNYFSVNMFTGLEKNPFIADQRQSDVFFATSQNFSIDAVVTLPDGYKIDELPKNVKMITADTSIVFSRKSNYSGGILSVLMTLEFKLPLYVVADYDSFKEFYKKLFGYLNDKYVYKKG